MEAGVVTASTHAGGADGGEEAGGEEETGVSNIQMFPGNQKLWGWRSPPTSPAAHMTPRPLPTTTTTTPGSLPM